MPSASSRSVGCPVAPAAAGAGPGRPEPALRCLPGLPLKPPPPRAGWCSVTAGAAQAGGLDLPDLHALLSGPRVAGGPPPSSSSAEPSTALRWGGGRGEWPQRLAPCPGVLGALCRAQLLQLVLTASSVPEGVPRVGPDPWPRGAHSCPSPWPAWWPPGLCQGPIARSHRAGFVSPESRGSCRLSVLPLETNLARLPRTPVSTQWATSVCVCGGGVT